MNSSILHTPSLHLSCTITSSPLYQMSLPSPSPPHYTPPPSQQTSLPSPGQGGHIDPHGDHIARVGLHVDSQRELGVPAVVPVNSQREQRLDYGLRRVVWHVQGHAANLRGGSIVSMLGMDVGARGGKVNNQSSLNNRSVRLSYPHFISLPPTTYVIRAWWTSPTGTETTSSYPPDSWRPPPAGGCIHPGRGLGFARSDVHFSQDHYPISHSSAMVRMGRKSFYKKTVI